MNALLQDLQPSKLQKIPKVERNEKLATLTEYNFEWPSKFLSQLLATLLKEAPDYGDDASCWVERLSPLQASVPVSVDPLKPSLGMLPMDTMERARLLSKLVLKDILTRQISHGEAGAATLSKWCDEVQKASWRAEGSKVDCPILKAAVEEAMCMTQAVNALYNQDCSSMAQVTSIMNGQSGNKYLLRSALSQNQFWREQYKKLQNIHSVQRHLGPELKAAEEALKIWCAGTAPILEKTLRECRGK